MDTVEAVTLLLVVCELVERVFFFFFQAEDGIRDLTVTGVQTCALPISRIAFLIPVPSTQRVKDWHVGCLYFKQTLSSILNSRADDYCIVAAGHEFPNFQDRKSVV